MRTSTLTAFAALLLLATSAVALPTMTVDTGFPDSGGDTGGVDTGGWDSGEVDFDDLLGEGDPPAGGGAGPMVQLPKRGCTRYHLKMSALDTDYYVRDLLGYDAIQNDGSTKHEYGWIETLDIFTWAVQDRTKNNPDTTELRAAVELALEEAKRANAAIGVWQDNDEDELRQKIVDAGCHVSAARYHLERAKQLYDALPADLRTKEGLQTGFRIMDESFEGGLANLAYIDALLTMQREACAGP